MRPLEQIALGVMVAVGLWFLPSSMAVAEQIPATLPTTVASEQTQYMRFVDQGVAGGRLETGEVTFTNNQGVLVHLVAAIHIAETSYYQALNQHFRDFDAVLYEMVKPRDMPPPPPGFAGDSSVARLQRFLKDVLELDYQLDVIDYRPGNFIHADLDAQTFERLQQQRGESFASLLLQNLLRALSEPQAQADPGVEDLLDLLTRPDMERQIKLVLARQLSDIERVSAGLDGPNGSVILTERNKAAVATLESAMKQGHRNIAIFYGAAHMPDMAKRLEELGFHPVKTDWRMAWDLHIRADQPSGVERLLGQALQGLDEPE